MCLSHSAPLLLLLVSLVARGRANSDNTADDMADEENARIIPNRTVMVHSISSPDDMADKENARIISNHTVMVHSISIPGVSAASEKTVIIDNPTNMELSCTLSIDLGSISAVEVYWKHNDKEIDGTRSTINKTGHPWHTLYKFPIDDSSHMGNYSCIFKADTEVNATFHLKVPKVKGADKPMITYERDSVVMKCDSSNYNPVEWIWYKVNESSLITLNESAMPSKYEVTRKRANETKLRIVDLSADDSGLYLCEAVFKVGDVKSRIQLNVLSYLIPLKPFLAIVLEVVILVAVILICELQTRKKQAQGDDKCETEQTEHLKSEDTNGVKSDATRQRKI
ncbi:embigin [Microcaecilia unicolor]|uniref:Embigin n=1 Tax=Microcaecilia unicolor TaxID=1415580 RepID=A0A6P7XBX2_9AMPH|nr:embigin [Microcaecilia unicolor]